MESSPDGHINTKKIRDIEVLRAFAVLGVLLHHLDGVLFPSLPGVALASMGLGSGVDLFFAVSGFVIARSLLPRLIGSQPSARSRVEVLAFWVRRAFRLWPTVWFWLAVILAVVASFRFEAEHLSLSTNVDAAIAGALHFANFRFADSFGQYAYGASFQFWTLSLEEQFYLLLPLLALLSGRRLVLVLVALIAIDLWRPVSLLSIATRSTALMIGVLIAVFSQTRLHRRFSKLFGGLGHGTRFAVMLGAVALVPWAETATPTIVQFHYGYVAAAAGLCVLLASFDQDGLCPAGVWTGVAQWMGARSYAIYVIHIPVFLVVGDLTQNRFGAELGRIAVTVPVVAAALALVLALAEFNYRIVEQPLRKVGVRVANRIATPRSSPAAPKILQEGA